MDDFIDIMEYTSEKSEKQNGKNEEYDENKYEQVRNTSDIMSSRSKNKVDFADIETIQSE